MEKQKKELRDREAYWRGMIETQRKSGKTISGFCRERGISSNSFFMWRKRLGESERGNFIEIEEEGKKGIGIYLELRGGVKIYLEKGFEEEELAKVLRVVKQ